MTDLEISKALALAIGWKSGDILINSGRCEVWFCKDWNADWTVFDYRDWNVIGPIAERYDCFPARIPATTGWVTSMLHGGSTLADTPQKAIALAVIGANK